MKNRNECTGCGLCVTICSKKAIRLEENRQGFLYPLIDRSLCIACGACDSICNKKIERAEAGNKGVYAFQSKNIDDLMFSTSGGIIPTIIRKVNDENGCSFSVTYRPNHDCGEWIQICDNEEIFKIYGSKYFQVPFPKTFIKALAEKTKYQNVLFVGLPCQVEMIKKTKVHNPDNLITVDIICGGATSYTIEKEYIKYIENKKKDRVIGRKFRGKEIAWGTIYHSVTTFEKGNVIEENGGENLFIRAFTSGSFLRESCYGCDFCSRQRTGDITVGDCWGLDEQTKNKLTYQNGVSLVLINTNKGKRLFDEVQSAGKFVKLDDSIMNNNKPLNVKNKRPNNRNFAYSLLSVLPFPFTIALICYRYSIKKILRSFIH